MHPLQGLTKLLKSLSVDIRQALIGLVVVGIVSAYGGLLYLSKSTLDYSILLLTMPTPLWATILLALLGCLYIYLKLHKVHSSSTTSQQTSYQEPQNKLIPKFGVYWDKNKEAYCPACQTLLSRYTEAKYESGEPYYYFHCIKCNKLVYLKDDAVFIKIQDARKKL